MLKCCGHKHSFDTGSDAHDGNLADSNSLSSLVSHWLSSSYNNIYINSNNLSSLTSLKSQYVRLPIPGKTFTSLQHLDHAFRELLRPHRAGHQDCSQL